MLYGDDITSLYDIDNPEEETGIELAETVRSKAIENYRVKLTKPGPMLEIEAYPVLKHKKEMQRAKKAKKTSAAQARVNQRNAAMKLNRLIQHNFPEYESYVIGLDYEISPTPEQAAKDREAFIRGLRRLYKKNGVTLKWLAVTPWTTKTGAPAKRLHHHIVITGGVDENAIRALWMRRGNGRIHLDPLQPDANGVTGLAKYLANHLHGAKRWTGSRNLVMPPSIYPKRHMSKAHAYTLAMDYEAARTIFERQHKDYTFVSMEVRFSDYVDGAYIYARMRKKNTAPRRR